ncbi:hypothetical protein [Paraburkholderia graminis]|uniref:hypothetical protein n=1 Tax=Paraburkholderia graminis TaxID=60548 RepID=UPI0038B9ECDB
MSGFERFDPRAWAEGGVTRHVAAKAQAVATSIRRAGTKFITQAVVAVTVAVAGGAVCAANASAQSDVLQEIVAEAGPAAAGPDRPVPVWASTSGAWTNASSLPMNTSDAASRAQDVRSAFVPDRSVLSSGTYQQFGTARQRFLSRQAVQMSVRTQVLAEKVLAQRDAGNSETGAEWAERLMKNMYS